MRLFEPQLRSSSSPIISLLSRFLVEKCLCRCLVDCLSSLTCALGIVELILWRCQRRAVPFLLADLVISLSLLWALFSEQYADRILLRMQSSSSTRVEQNRTESRQRRSFIIASCRSLVFSMQLLLASLPFLITFVSYSSTGMAARLRNEGDE